MFPLPFSTSHRLSELQATAAELRVARTTEPSPSALRVRVGAALVSLGSSLMGGAERAATRAGTSQFAAR